LQKSDWGVKTSRITTNSRRNHNPAPTDEKTAAKGTPSARSSVHPLNPRGPDPPLFASYAGFDFFAPQRRLAKDASATTFATPFSGTIMSALFLKRFLQRPMQVASIVPSSRTLIKKVVMKMDLAQPRVIAEFGPGEGCHTREIARRMHPGSTLLLFELERELAGHLERQFRNDARVVVLNKDALSLSEELAARSLSHCDYVVSGIPFSILEPEKKRALLRKVHESLTPGCHAAFIIYQVTNELVGHCQHFPRKETEYCLRNLPPMFVTKFYKSANGHANGVHGTNGHAHGGSEYQINGHGRH
jgi:phosphatidylethanolamine/phosphatidyl-N-methylethanolamine N-methyltransferase